MPRLYTSTYTWRPSVGRTAASTRRARTAGRPGFFSSRFSRFRPNFNYNDLLRRLSRMYEYGHRGHEHDTSDQEEKPDPEKEDVLGVEAVDFNIPDNCRLHNTSEYDITDADEVKEPKLVVRRGQPFDISVTFNRAYDKTKDELRIVFQAGENPTPGKATHVEIILSDKDEPKRWGAKIKSQNDKTLNVTIFTPPLCYVARWNFKLDVLKKKDNKKVIFRYNHKEQVYILFNPWCKEDPVYMEGEKDKAEYVMNENGVIYRGSYRSISGKAWNFGQFQDHVLDCCMDILDKSGISWAVRGNPIPVSRKITALVNAPDDNGILVGNWSGDYEGGTSPLEWNGSVAILEEYYKTKEPVCYGQCWVFSGVTTTVCRALGIPARSVTNFASAHDTDGSITIDTMFDAEGEVMEGMSDDSVWNFHVWNEAWMTRPDLPTGYGGWQAIDATPQETSDGVYCCGPMPVFAIKKGEVNLPFDGTFIFAEVNADRIMWMLDENQEFVKAAVQKNSVGKFISTKAMTSSDREDVTIKYKFPEGCDEERVAVLKANQVGSCRDDIYKIPKQDVTYELDHSEDRFVGNDFDVILKMTNTSQETRKLAGRLAASTMYYTGVRSDAVKNRKFECTLEPGKSHEEKMNVTWEDYHSLLKDMCMLQLMAMSKTENLQIFTNCCDFRLRKPHLEIKAPAEGQVGTKFQAEVSFTNPLAEPLTGCSLTIEGPGLQKPETRKLSTVGQKQTFMTTIDLTPRKKGDRELILSFNSKQLMDVNGKHSMKIKPK